VWLFGSRVNGTQRQDSDWDFLVFGTKNVLDALRRNSKFNRDDIDLLVLYNSEDFEKPWGEKQKSGSLSEWDWKELSSEQATYRATKPVFNTKGEEEFNVKVMQCKALRVYP
jgi:predicted nucleotidyltransferase